MDNPLSPAFIIGTIHIGTIEGASCFNMGNNWPTNFRSFKKHNQGFGTVKGSHASITGTRSLLNDPDVIDFPTFNEKTLPAWLKQMLQQDAVQSGDEIHPEFMESSSNPLGEDESSSEKFKGGKCEGQHSAHGEKED